MGCVIQCVAFTYGNSMLQAETLQKQHYKVATWKGICGRSGNSRSQPNCMAAVAVGYLPLLAYKRHIWCEGESHR